jgi:hypothetical protein
MDRRNFLKSLSAICGSISVIPFAAGQSARSQHEKLVGRDGKRELAADVVIAGGGIGGCTAALAALRNGLRVILTEETDWIGGQFTQQGVPPDEHRWIESFGSTRSYREFRTAVRDYYRRYYPLTEDARARWNLNPGDGSVSRLCFEPRVGLAILSDLLAPYLSARTLILLLEHKIVAADVTRDKVTSLKARSLRSGNEVVLSAPFYVDATELGDLLPMTGTEFVTGAESKAQTRELHAVEEADPQNQQAFTMCFAADYRPGEDHTIDKPREYAFWKDYVPAVTPPWPGRLLDWTYTHPPTLTPRVLGFDPEKPTPGAVNLWQYRRITNKGNFRPGIYAGDTTLVNWPQNDYLLGPLVGVPEAEAAQHVQRAKQLSLSLLYWMQTEAPRPDGGNGFPGLRLREDLLGTEDGLAKYPYVREARRIEGLFTVTEEHVGLQNRVEVSGQTESDVIAADFPDTVGVGSYHIDLHPSTAGNNYVDFAALPFQIPLGCLIPRRLENLLPANKNIATTHITNGCYRLHPVEWNIGESVGCLVAFALKKKTLPRAVRESPQLLKEFQDLIRNQGIETHWPKGRFW